MVSAVSAVASPISAIASAVTRIIRLQLRIGKDIDISGSGITGSTGTVAGNRILRHLILNRLSALRFLQVGKRILPVVLCGKNLCCNDLPVCNESYGYGCRMISFSVPNLRYRNGNLIINRIG